MNETQYVLFRQILSATRVFSDTVLAIDDAFDLTPAAAESMETTVKELLEHVQKLRKVTP